MSTRVPISLSNKEKERLEKLAAKADQSLSNYIRSRLGLEPLAHGGPRANSGKTKRQQAKEEKA